MNHKRLCRVLRRLWFFHFHINLKSTELRAACCRLPAAGRWCLAACRSSCSLLQRVKPKFLSPNSFSTMAQITPTTVSLWKYKTRQRTDMKHLRYSVCILHTHTCGARTVESHWRAYVSGRARQSKGRSMMTFRTSSCLMTS